MATRSGAQRGAAPNWKLAEFSARVARHQALQQLGRAGAAFEQRHHAGGDRQLQTELMTALQHRARRVHALGDMA